MLLVPLLVVFDRVAPLLLLLDISSICVADAAAGVTALAVWVLLLLLLLHTRRHASHSVTT